MRERQPTRRRTTPRQRILPRFTKKWEALTGNRAQKEIECLIRGLDPWPSAYTRLGDKMLKIWKAQVVSEESGAEPGCIVKVEKRSYSGADRKGNACHQ